MVFASGWRWPRARDRGTAFLTRLGRPTRELFRDLEAEGIVRTINDTGHLNVFGSAASAEARRRAVRDRMGERGGLVGELLDAGGLRAYEPYLGGAARAGFLVRDQWAIDPGDFVDNLAAALRADGVELLEGARVTGIDDRGGAVTVRSSAGNARADVVVVAAGIGSAGLCRGLGVRLPVVPGKGYSTTGGGSARSSPRRRRTSTASTGGPGTTNGWGSTYVPLRAWGPEWERGEGRRPRGPGGEGRRSSGCAPAWPRPGRPSARRPRRCGRRVAPSGRGATAGSCSRPPGPATWTRCRTPCTTWAGYIDGTPDGLPEKLR
ncbi:MAG TPA: FAD-dependent oxidoreductase [Streptosporangiaceae bacterium]